MHYLHFLPRSRYFFDGMMWNNPYFWIPNLIGLVLFIVGIVILVKVIRKHRRIEPSVHSEALDVLKLKFVNGEIDEETYKRKMALLK